MRRLLALATAVIPMIWLAAPATAAGGTLHVTPHSVPAGGTVRVSGGSCEPHRTQGYAISPAFVNGYEHGHDFAGVGAVSFTTNSAGYFSVTAQVAAGTAPGSYWLTVRCGGGNYGGTTLTVTAAAKPAAAKPAAGSAPTAVPAGTGGLAATGHTPHPQSLLLGGAGLLLLVAGGALLRVRRRTRPAG
jgi:hypothetical protein